MGLYVLKGLVWRDVNNCLPIQIFLKFQLNLQGEVLSYSVPALPRVRVWDLQEPGDILLLINV